jgi:hypothetical protein
MTHSELESFLALEISDLPAEAYEKFSTCQCRMQRVACVREGKLDADGLLLFGARESNLLIYDEVEDEFGIATRADSQPIHSWRLFEGLRFALAEL